MNGDFSNKSNLSSIFAQLFLICLAPLFLINVIPPEQWLKGVIPGDSQLNLWALSWQWQTILTEPMNLWNGNAFYPFQNVITGSDHLFTQVLTGLPIYLLTRNPFLSYHFVLFISYAIGALGIFRLVFYFYRQTPPALAAAVFFTVALPRTIHASSHIQIACLAWLPWSVYFLYQIFRVVHPVYIAGLIVSSVLQILCGWYIAVYHGIVLSVVAFCLILKHRQRKTILVLLASGLITIGCVMPFAIPYIGRSEVDPMVWSYYGTTLKEFVSPASYTVYTGGTGVRGFWSETTVWMGFLAPCLGLITLIFRDSRQRSNEKPVSMLPFVLLVMIGVLLSCGTNLPIPSNRTPWMLLARLPGVSGMRVPARAVMITVFAISILFGRATWIISRRLLVKKYIWPVTLLLTGIVMVENFPVIKIKAASASMPEVYHWLKQLPDETPIAEVPSHYGTDLWAFSADYMQNASLHGHPVANGYSRYVPDGFSGVSKAINRLPALDAINTLRKHGVFFVILHPQRCFDDYMYAKFAQMGQIDEPVTIFNTVISQMNSNYIDLISARGIQLELSFLNSPHMDLVARFGPDSIYYLNDPSNGTGYSAHPNVSISILPSSSDNSWLNNAE